MTVSRDKGQNSASHEERPPRLRLIRVFLSVLVGSMAGLMGWMVVAMAVVLRQGVVTQLPMLPPVLQTVAFMVPAVVVGYWTFAALGSSR